MAEIKVEGVEYNQNGDDLPFGYYNPETEGKLTWICNYDQESRPTSVFCFNDGVDNDRRCQYVSLGQAVDIRDELIAHGWMPLKPPTVTFTMGGEKKDADKLNYKERRMLNKRIKKLRKNGLTDAEINDYLSSPRGDTETPMNSPTRTDSEP